MRNTMPAPRGRRGVASVIGTMLFLVVLMIAMGAQAYVWNLQAQSDQAAQQAMQVISQKDSERLSFSSGTGGVSVVQDGPVSAGVVALVLKYANGTVFDLPVSAVIPSGETAFLQPLVPSGGCGLTGCQRRYSAIVSGSAQGSIGLVTSFGNTFWYVPSQGGADSPQSGWTSSPQSTSSTTYSPVTGLSFAGSQNGHYQVSVDIGYYQSAQTIPGMIIGVSIPTGATMVVCGQMSYPDTILGCTTSPNAAIGSTVFSGNSIVQANYCASSSNPCIFALTAYVTFGTNAGTFQVEFKTGGSTTVTIIADSVLTVVQD